MIDNERRLHSCRHRGLPKIADFADFFFQFLDIYILEKMMVKLRHLRVSCRTTVHLPEYEGLYKLALL